ncbi:proteasomal ATPase-associated factor 1, partial [Caerostris extrusa]
MSASHSATQMVPGSNPALHLHLENGGTAWVSCREYGKNSIHGKLTSVKSSENKEHSIAASEHFKVRNITNVSLCLEYEDLNCSCEFYAPSTVFSKIHQKKVTSLDVTKELCVSVCSENKLLIWNALTGTILRRPCVGWKCAVTLTGHTAAVTDTAIVDRGRNIVTLSKDGTARLWDCGKSSCCLHVISKENGNINCCAVAPVDINVGVQ